MHKKVKCTLVQALRLCTGRTAHRGSRGIALLFHDLALEGGEGSASRPSRSIPSGKTRYPLYRRLGRPPGPVWTGAEILASTGIQSPDRPARSQSLYRLSYPAHTFLHEDNKLRLPLPGGVGLNFGTRFTKNASIVRTEKHSTVK